VVVTIDPAKRLADTLGIGSLSNTATRIAGEWPGELWALMLDTKSTFDDLVTTYAPDRAQAERILANRFYRNISGALSGTQEYMAGEKLYELHELGADTPEGVRTRFDLVVVDTPPTRNALDFLDASRRLTTFLDHRIYRMLMAPTRAYSRRSTSPPRPSCGRSAGSSAGRCSTTHSPSSPPSRGWRRGSGTGPPRSAPSSVPPARPSCSWRHPAGTPWTRPPTSPRS
jgi:anion-transporting  ArsA/GET3 family ATPase